MNEAEVTTEELREMIREGHGMVKDLGRVIKEAKAVIAQMQDAVQEAKDAPREETLKVIHEVTEEATKDIAKEVAVIANQATTLVTDTIFQRFDVLMEALLGLHKDDDSIPAILRKQQQAGHIDIDLSSVDLPIDRTMR